MIILLQYSNQRTLHAMGDLKFVYPTEHRVKKKKNPEYGGILMISLAHLANRFPIGKTSPIILSAHVSTLFIFIALFLHFFIFTSVCSDLI